MIEIAKERDLPYIEVAEKIAIKKFNTIKITSEKPNTKNQIKNKIKVMIPRAYQKIFIKPKAKKMFSKILSQIEQPF